MPARLGWRDRLVRAGRHPGKWIRAAVEVVYGTFIAFEDPEKVKTWCQHAAYDAMRVRRTTVEVGAWLLMKEYS